MATGSSVVESYLTVDFVLARCVEYGGKLIAEFNQNETKYPWIADKDQGGACLTLCLLWAKRDAQGQLGSGVTFLQHVKVSPKIQTDISKIQEILMKSRYQQEHRDGILNRETNLAPDGPEKRIGLFMDYARRTFPTEDDKMAAYFNAVADAVSGDISGYRQIQMFFPKDSSHAVAARYFKKEFVFFDPNGGVAEFPSRDKFHEWFLKLYIPKTQYRKATIFRVNNYVPSAD